MYQVTFIDPADHVLRVVNTPTLMTADTLTYALWRAGYPARMWDVSVKGQPRLITS